MDYSITNETEVRVYPRNFSRGGGFNLCRFWNLGTNTIKLYWEEATCDSATSTQSARDQWSESYVDVVPEMSVTSSQLTWLRAWEHTWHLFCNDGTSSSCDIAHLWKYQILHRIQVLFSLWSWRSGLSNQLVYIFANRNSSSPVSCPVFTSHFDLYSTFHDLSTVHYHALRNWSLHPTLPYPTNQLNPLHRSHQFQYYHPGYAYFSQVATSHKIFRQKLLPAFLSSPMHATSLHPPHPLQFHCLINIRWRVKINFKTTKYNISK